MDHILAVEVVDGPEDLLNRLGGVPLRELALLADAVEKLTAGRELRHDVVLVLRGAVSRQVRRARSHPTWLD